MPFRKLGVPVPSNLTEALDLAAEVLSVQKDLLEVILLSFQTRNALD
jgi:hypothetical protein